MYQISSVNSPDQKMLNTSAKLFLFVYAAYLVVNISSGCLWFVVTYNTSGREYRGLKRKRLFTFAQPEVKQPTRCHFCHDDSKDRAFVLIQVL